MTCTVNLLDDINPDEAVKTAGRGREDEASEKKKKFKGWWLAILAVVGNQKNINKVSGKSTY